MALGETAREAYTQLKGLGVPRAEVVVRRVGPPGTPLIALVREEALSGAALRRRGLKAALLELLPKRCKQIPRRSAPSRE